MVKNKAEARPCCTHPSLVSLSLSFSLTNAVHPEGTPGSCWGWTPAPPPSFAFKLSQHKGLFQWVSSLHQMTKVIGVSASASVLPMNIQGWFPLRLMILISLQSKGFSSLFQNHNYKVSSLVLSLLYDSTLTSIHDYWKNHSFDCTDLCRQSDVLAF